MEKAKSLGNDWEMPQKEDGQDADEDIVYLYLKNRKGFIKHAMDFDIPITPAFIFGQHKLWRVATLPEWITESWL